MIDSEEVAPHNIKEATELVMIGRSNKNIVSAGAVGIDSGNENYEPDSKNEIDSIQIEPKVNEDHMAPVLSGLCDAQQPQTPITNIEQHLNQLDGGQSEIDGFSVSITAIDNASETPQSPSNPIISMDSSERLEEDLKVDKEDNITKASRLIPRSNIICSPAYRVESPKTVPTRKDRVNSKLAGVKKCRSLDDDRDDLVIQELSDASSSAAENENTPLVSEAESEAEGDFLSESGLARSSDTLFSVQTLPLDSGLRTLNMSEREEQNLRGFLVDTLHIDIPMAHQRAPEPSKSAAATKREKRAAIQTHFMPQFLNPKCLDVIREENSDVSDAESRPKSGTSLNYEMEGDDDVFYDNDAISRKANAVYPKSHFDFSQIKRHTNLRAPKTEIIREEPPCILVDTKIVEAESVEESSKRWTTSVTGKQHHAEVVYLDSGSSCTSLSDAGDSAAEADVEDLNSESEIRIEMPTIEGHDLQIHPLPATQNQSVPLVVSVSAIAESVQESSNETPSVCDETCRGSKEQTPTQNDRTTECVVNQSDINNSPPETKPCDNNILPSGPEFKIGEPCSNNMFDPVTNLTSFVQSSESDLKTSNIVRQDSSSSHCSSHSTSHSQSTARYLASTSQTDLADPAIDQIAYVSGYPEQLKPTEDGQCPSLREICVDRLHSMPYGNAILEELANVSQSLNHLTDKHQQKPQHQQPVEQVYDLPYHNPYEQANQRSYQHPNVNPYDNPYENPYENPYQEAYEKSYQSHQRYYEKPYYQQTYGKHYPKIQEQPSYIQQPPAVPEMPYPMPDLPYIDDLEVQHHRPYARGQCPEPPPRSKKPRTVALVPNYSIKSPPPPPVPDRPWLGIPTDDDPSVLVCFSPAQRQFMQENEGGAGITSPDQLLAMHNQFVDRRGYFEFTDDEVHAINFKKTFNESETNAKDDNKLLALIREINQLTSATESVATDEEKKSATATTATAMPLHTEPFGGPKQCTDGVSDEKMFADKQFPASTATFNKRYSNYEKFVPIGERASNSNEPHRPKPKRFSNIETSTFESRKRVENGNVIYDISDSNVEKSQKVDDNESPQTYPNYSIDDMRKKFFTGEDHPNALSKLDQPIINTDGSMHHQQQHDLEERRHHRSSFETNKNSSTTYAATTTESRESNAATEMASDVSGISDTTPLGLDPRLKSDWFNRDRFSFKEFDYIPKFFTDIFGKGNSNEATQGSGTESANVSSATGPTSGIGTADAAKTVTIDVKKESDLPNPETNRNEAPNKEDQTSQLTNEKVSRLQKHNEMYTSTQSLREWLENVKHPDSLSGGSTPIPGLQPPRSSVYHKGRISPCVQVRAPRITESPVPSTERIIDESQRHYDWYTTKHARRYENRQSMIDQTPITRHVRGDTRRQSLPRALHDKQLGYILEKEEELNREFEQLEKDRMKLVQDLEEMKVNQNFEEFFRKHKLRNNAMGDLHSLSQAELFRRQMQDEWLQQVAEREERRLHKIIKVTKSAEEVSGAAGKLFKRGIGDEFLDRVKERRTKLQIPSDSDWESGAESQPTPREKKPDQIDPNIKVLDGANVADIKSLPKHIKEFAEFAEAAATDNTSQSREILHRIHVEGESVPEDGESPAWSLTLVGVCVALAAAICWTLSRSMFSNTNLR